MGFRTLNSEPITKLLTWCMAERVGFEPTSPFGRTAFRERRLKPLGNLSVLLTSPKILPSSSYCHASSRQRVGCAQSLRSLRLPFGSPNPRLLVLSHYVPSASPLNFRGSPGEPLFESGALNLSATSPSLMIVRSYEFRVRSSFFSIRFHSLNS